MTGPATGRDVEAARRAVVRWSAELASMTPGTTGNLSVRAGEQFAITPTGVAYDELDAGDVSVVTLEGNHVEGLAPSSETPMHRGTYEAAGVGAIVHTHSPWATTLSTLGEPVPPVHYMVALAGPEVPVAAYATYGTTELAENAVAAMERAESRACLLANHGLLASGPDAEAAFEVARAVEATARVYCQASASGLGEPKRLPDAEIEAVARKFESYGQ